MLIGIVSGFLDEKFMDYDFLKFFIVLVLGGIIGTILALRVKMISMP